MSSAVHGGVLLGGLSRSLERWGGGGMGADDRVIGVALGTHHEAGAGVRRWVGWHCALQEISDVFFRPGFEL